MNPPASEPGTADPFGFTPGWFTLGLVNDALLATLRQEWSRGEDDNPEHYRYDVFSRFMDEHPVLATEVAIALWELAEHDRDLCWTIRTRLVQRRDCPAELIEAARASGRKHLLRLLAFRGA